MYRAKNEIVCKLTTIMTQYELLKNAVEEKGELMLKSETGEKFELHKHNTSFDDQKKIIKIDGAEEVYWLDPEKVSYYWIHKEARKS